MLRSGVRSLAAAAALSLGGCLYGFAGGGLPASVRTVAIVPFENETPSPDLTREVVDALRREMRNRLGVRDANQARADAVVRGTIVRYDVDVPISYTADQSRNGRRSGVTTARRKLQIVVDISIIEQSNGKTLFTRKGLLGEAEYAERAEASGRRQAIDKIVSDVIEGAQSQW
jgi:hypothetical protein